MMFIRGHARPALAAAAILLLILCSQQTDAQMQSNLNLKPTVGN
jgi:hypothetical protein